MTRCILSIIALLAITAPAEAAMMVHYDLAGLLLHSESVVVAERVGDAAGKPDHGTYRVVRVVRGTRPAGADLDLYDGLYMPVTGLTIDREVVLFLDKSGSLVSSGMRVFVGGKVFRFEQWSNPGGWHPVAQGEDPIDQWEATAQLDRAGLDKAITAAGKRIDAFNAAVAERDPAKRRAAVLALFTPAGGNREGMGFYHDVLADRARTALGSAGDVEGALLVGMRDRGGSSRRTDFAHVPQLVAIATDTKRDLDLRLTALGYARQRLTDDVATLRLALPLVDDADPRMRAAAIDVNSGVTQASSSEAAYNRGIAALKLDLMAMLAKRFARETDHGVLVAIAAAYEMWKAPMPPRSGGPAQFARARLRGNRVDVDVRCTTPIRAHTMRVLATAGGVTNEVSPANVWLNCAGDSNGISGGVSRALVPGRYTLTVELHTKPKATTLPLGTLVVDASQHLRIEP